MHGQPIIKILLFVVVVVALIYDSQIYSKTMYSETTNVTCHRAFFANVLEPNQMNVHVLHNSVFCSSNFLCKIYCLF